MKELLACEESHFSLKINCMTQDCVGMWEDGGCQLIHRLPYIEKGREHGNSEASLHTAHRPSPALQWKISACTGRSDGDDVSEDKMEWLIIALAFLE